MGIGVGGGLRLFETGLEESLEVPLCWAEAVGGPAVEEAEVVVGELLVEGLISFMFVVFR